MIMFRNQNSSDSLPIPAFDLNISHLHVDSIAMDKIHVTQVEIDNTVFNESFQAIYSIFICMFVMLVVQTGCLLYLNVRIHRFSKTKGPGLL